MKAAQFLDGAKTTPKMPGPFQQLCVLEPALVDLWQDAVYYRWWWSRRPAERRRGLDASWATLRRDLWKLVGLGRPDHDDILGSIQAYDCAYKALLDAIGA